MEIKNEKLKSEREREKVKEKYAYKTGSFPISKQYLFTKGKLYWNQDRSNEAECANGKRENHFRKA